MRTRKTITIDTFHPYDHKISQIKLKCVKNCDIISIYNILSERVTKMAKAAEKQKKEVTMEEALWKSADKLRGAIEPAEYKHVVLSLFFLKFASDKFVKCREKIIKNHGEKYADMKPFYTQENVFYLPEESRWNYIIENAKQDDIALKIDTALFTIERTIPL